MTDKNEPANGVSRRTVLQASAASVGALGVAGTTTAHDNHEDTDMDDEEGENDEMEGSNDEEQREDIITETADVYGQAPDNRLVARDGATIHRTPNEILIDFRMPTPVPGTYTYPSGPPNLEDVGWTDQAGDLEAFTLWAFVFDYPEECEDDCGAEDLGDPAGGGAFDVSGRAVELSRVAELTLHGFISTETDVYEENGEVFGVPMERPQEAEVHLAIAPHGAFDPDMMPEILTTRTGPADVWWTAIFDPRE